VKADIDFLLVFFMINEMSFVLTRWWWKCMSVKQFGRVFCLLDLLCLIYMQIF